jgi:DNA primase
VAQKEAPAILEVNGRGVRITHPSKLYFSAQTQLTKLDLVRYYLSITEGALRGIRDRPLVLKRFVDGAEGEVFYQKRAPGRTAGWPRRSGSARRARAASRARPASNRSRWMM